MPDTDPWDAATPESQRMSRERLDAWRDDLARRHTSDLLVLRNGVIVYEWHQKGRLATSRHGTASLAKALVGGMSLLLALTDRRLDLDAPVARWVPEWREHPLKSQITIRQLATHSSGIEDANAPTLGHLELAGWKEAFWRRTPDPFTVARDQAPLCFRPGAAYAYSNPGMAMLAYAATASYRGTEYPDLRTLLRERIMRPLGIPDEEWRIGYSQTYQVNGLPLIANWGGGEYTARAAALVGLLMMREGRWQNCQILPAESVRTMLSGARTPEPDRIREPAMPVPGLCWWLNADGGWPQLPRDTFLGAGAGHQILLCIPSMDLLVVRFGDWLGEATRFGESWADLLAHLVDPLLDTLLPRIAADCERAPYPPSPVIRRIRFDPPSTIVRLAYDSDNWPLTWADDGALYAAYGDGRGFRPFTERKLGLGFAKIVGAPTRFRGINIRSETGENLGMGASGAKASGLLSVDGVLYMLTRNAKNARLARSTDHGHTWLWADWRFTTSFGYPTFLNFGRDYANARDTFVYLYSHDADSAYVPADRFVLARVRRDRICERTAYEFFVRCDEDGQPLWSPDVEERGAVFVNPGRCARSSACYNAGLGRYLWWQNIPRDGQVDTRFRGGFGIYDAPTPWGPWTTAYFTEEWDVGPGEMGSLPTMWMSAGGHVCYLVFSGHDYFSLRRLLIET